MSRQYWFDIAYESESESGTKRYLAPTRTDAERQFLAWWDFHTDWMAEKFPVPSHWCTGMEERENSLNWFSV